MNGGIVVQRWFNPLAMSLVLAACAGGEESAPAAEAPKAEKAAPAPAAAAAEQATPEGPSVDDTTFVLALSRKSPEALELRLEGRGGYHVNQDYPFKVELSGSEGVTLPKASFGKDDAAEFSEERARLEVPVEVAEGAQEVTAKVRFAVCTEETCVPDKRTLKLALAP